MPWCGLRPHVAVGEDGGLCQGLQRRLRLERCACWQPVVVLIVVVILLLVVLPLPASLALLATVRTQGGGEERDVECRSLTY